MALHTISLILSLGLAVVVAGRPRIDVDNQAHPAGTSTPNYAVGSPHMPVSSNSSHAPQPREPRIGEMLATTTNTSEYAATIMQYISPGMRAWNYASTTAQWEVVWAAAPSGAVVGEEDLLIGQAVAYSGWYTDTTDDPCYQNLLIGGTKSYLRSDGVTRDVDFFFGWYPDDLGNEYVPGQAAHRTEPGDTVKVSISLSSPSQGTITLENLSKNTKVTQDLNGTALCGSTEPKYSSTGVIVSFDLFQQDGADSPPPGFNKAAFHDIETVDARNFPRYLDQSFERLQVNTMKRGGITYATPQWGQVNDFSIYWNEDPGWTHP